MVDCAMTCLRAARFGGQARQSPSDNRGSLCGRARRVKYRTDHRQEIEAMNLKTSTAHRTAALDTPKGLGLEATRDVSGALNALLADFFALYLKTKNFHWHVSGPHFRDYHLLLDEHADQLYATTDPIAERVRKLGGTTLRSIGHIARLQRVLDNDAEFVTPLDMLAELREDNQRLVQRMRQTHNVCEEYGDVATASLLEVWIDEAERRAWFLFETTRSAESAGR
jgi:starvation-inducible DNA-binding protein